MLTDHGIKAMGYEENNPPLIIECKFYCLKVYCIKGVHFAPDEGEYIGRLSEYSYFGIGSNVNDICMKLANDVYCEDFDQWKSEKNATAPFLVTLTTNGVDYSENCKWIQRCEGQIHTYGCFLKAKIDLDTLIAEHEIPLTLASNSCNTDYL